MWVNEDKLTVVYKSHKYEEVIIHMIVLNKIDRTLSDTGLKNTVFK